MNQPTREEFEEFKQEIRQEVRQLREQRTEEIKAVRVEVASEDVINRLKTLEQGQQELKEDTTVLKDNVGVLKIEMQGARADILQIRKSQADLRDTLEEHGQRLERIEQTQGTHTEILDKLVDFAESHDAMLKGHIQHFDRIEATMATKDDVTSIKNDATSIKGDIGRLEGIMMQILNRLPKTEGE